MKDITRSRGDTYGDVFVLKKKGRPVDINGFTFVLTVDPSATPETSANNLFSLTGVMIDGVNGKVEFAPTAQQANQTPGTYYYGIQLTDTYGRIRTVQSGKYTITQDITK